MAKISHLLCLALFALSFISSFASNPENSDQEIRSFVYAHHHHHQKEELGIYELKKGNFSAKFTNFGAAIVSLIVPDKFGKLADVVLGYDSVKEYLNDASNLGVVVGRVANRIAGAQFTYNGTHYKLIANDGKNTLHGGPKGFGHVTWTVDKYDPKARFPYITFSYFSVDGDQGFPGDLEAKVTYRIGYGNELIVTMVGKPLNKATPVNLANHAYWNLKGHNKGNILNHEIQIFASHITPVDESLIPTGKFESVKGTPYDFIKPRTIGSRINELPNGYDINYVLDVGKTRSIMKPVGVVREKESGRVMELWGNKPGVQFYTSNGLNNVKGKGGYVYRPHGALCLETQGFPDAVNHPNFPSVIVAPGEIYKHYMLFRFSTMR